MKMLVAAVALATLVASPAFAQSYDPDLGTGNIAPPSDDPAYDAGVYQGGSGAYAQVPYGAHNRVAPGGYQFRSYASPNAVYDQQGNVYGADPDPNIRAQRRRESEQGEW